MQNLTDVRFVYAHPEGARCDDHVHLIGEKGPEDAATNAGAQTGVVRRGPDAGAQQRSGDELRETTRRRVDERCTGSTPDARTNQGEPFAIVADLLREERQIRPIE